MPPVLDLEKMPQVPMLGLKTLWFQVAGTICNLRCSHCFISCSPENTTHKMMSRAQVRLYLEEAEDLGIREFYFTGGEPFLNRELPEILLDALTIAPATVLTNGMLISQKMAERLRDIQTLSLHPLTFRVSLDGATEEENDKIRGQGVFTKATQGICNLRMAGFEPIITACQTDSKRNPQEFRKGFEDLARSLGQQEPRLKILPPLLMGAMEKLDRPYQEHERVTDACFVNYPFENLQCSSGRMVTAEGVYVCPILIDEPGALMGQTIAETLKSFPLAYSACYTCRMQGLSCANGDENLTIVSEVKHMNTNGKSNGNGTVTRDDVEHFYAQAAIEPKPELCCPGGYADQDTAHIPQEVLDRAYGCGSPIDPAHVTAGETVADLGCGAGIDVFVASKKTGRNGRVIGIDMTPEMLGRALEAATLVAKTLGFRNTEFRHGYLEEIPLENETADLVTSNCVLNLSTNKKKVFQEIHRVLADKGRFVIADIVSEKPLPEHLAHDKNLWGECLAGALTQEQFMETAQSSGFYGLEILKHSFYKEVEGFKFHSVTVRGWKFKKGQECLYIGQHATYSGPYYQVADDEGHIYHRGIPFEICTDTATKLQLPPYQGQFTISNPTQAREKTISCAPTKNENSCC